LANKGELSCDYNGNDVTFQYDSSIVKNFKGDIALYPNSALASKKELKNPKINETIKDSAYTQTEIVHSIDYIWSIFGMMPKVIVVAQPLANDCDTKSSIAIVLNLRDIIYNEIYDKQFVILVYILVNVIFLTTVGFFRMSKVIIKPLENLVRLSESYSLTGNDLLITPPRKNEFGLVATALQNMFSRIETDNEKLKKTISSLQNANKKILENQKKLISTEKFAVVGRLSAGLAHEIGNPLGIIQGYIDLLGRDDITHAEKIEYSQRSTKELCRVNKLIRQLLDISRKGDSGSYRTAIKPVIENLVGILRHQQNVSTIHFEMHFDTVEGYVCLNEDDLHQVLLNCLLNSIDAIHENNSREGVISIECRSVHENNDINDMCVEIDIIDNGIGIQKNVISTIFDPFFTTKELGQGTGLGLSVSLAMVENVGGTIKITSETTDDTIVNTKVTITLPVRLKL
jgi:hypothetical protein